MNTPIIPLNMVPNFKELNSIWDQQDHDQQHSVIVEGFYQQILDVININMEVYQDIITNLKDNNFQIETPDGNISEFQDYLEEVFQ